MRIVLAGLIAILVIGNAGAESKRHPTQQQIQSPIANPTQPTAQDQRGTDQVPFTVKVIPSENAKDKADREERERWIQDEKAAVDKRLADETQRLADETGNLAIYTRWLAGFTVLLFFAALVQIGLFVWQLRTIRASLGHTKTAANAALQSAKAAIDAQRPWIKLDVNIASDLSDDGNGARLQFDVTISNVGNSPATDIEVWSPMVCGGNGIPWVIAFTKIPQKTNLGFSIFPKESSIVDRWGRITPDEINAALAKTFASNQIDIGVVAFSRYSFIGGTGETTKAYLIGGPNLMQRINIGRLPIPIGSLILQEANTEDVVL
jgi:hypothetical protein